jgi:hypothetical protein
VFSFLRSHSKSSLIRFQMNHTDPPHNQFIKKPVYTAMGLLSFLGDEYLNREINSTDPLLTVLVTRTSGADQSNTAILLAYADSDEVNIETIKTVKLGINNLSIGSRFVVYLLDNILTNPYSFWQAWRPSFSHQIRATTAQEARGSPSPVRPYGHFNARPQYSG